MQVQSNFQQPLQIRPLNDRVYKLKPKLETYNPIAHFQQKFDIDQAGFIQKQNGLQFGNFSTVDYGGGSKIVNQKSDNTFQFQFPRHFKSNRPQVFSNPITGESIDFKQKKPISYSNRASPRQSVNFDNANQPQQTNQKSVFIESAFQQLSPTYALSFDFMKAQQTFKKNARRDIFRDPINGREIKFNLPKQIIGSLDNQRIQVQVDPEELEPQASTEGYGKIQKDQKILNGNAKKQIFTGYISPMALSSVKKQGNEQGYSSRNNQVLNYAQSLQNSPKIQKAQQFYKLQEEQQNKEESYKYDYDQKQQGDQKINNNNQDYQGKIFIIQENPNVVNSYVGSNA